MKSAQNSSIARTYSFAKRLAAALTSTLALTLTSACQYDFPLDPEGDALRGEKHDIGLPHSVLRYHLIFNRCGTGPAFQVGAVTEIQSLLHISDPLQSEPTQISWGPGHFTPQTFNLVLTRNDQTQFSSTGTLLVNTWSEHNRSEYQAAPCVFGGTADVPLNEDLDLDSIAHVSVTMREERHASRTSLRTYAAEHPNLHQHPALWEQLMREPAYNSSLFSNTQIKLLQGDGARTGRLDFAFLAEGFTQSQIDEGLFEQKVQDHLDQLFQIEPYRAWQNRINVWLVLTPSREAGVSDVAVPTHRDTFYGLTKNFSCSRMSSPTHLHRVYAAANLVPHDVTILLFNAEGDQTSAFYGGGFEPYMTLDTVEEGNVSLLPHELGHYVSNFVDHYFPLPNRPMPAAQGAPRNADLSAAVGCSLPSRPQDPISYVREVGRGIHIDPRRGRNMADLQPGDPIPWRHHIPAQRFQGLTRFAYPISQGGWHGDPSTSTTITYQLRNEGDLETPVLLFGTHYPRYSDTSELVLPTSISINGESEPINPANLRIADENLAFYQLHISRLPKGMSHTLYLTFAEHRVADHVLRSILRSTTLAITHRMFWPTEVGAYEGTFSSLFNQYRPSFQGMMNTHYLYPEFNAYELELLNADLERLAR